MTTTPPRVLRERIAATLETFAASGFRITPLTEETLTNVLREDPALSEFAAERLRLDGTGTSRVSAGALARWCIRFAQRNGVEATLEALDLYASARDLPLSYYLGVRGFEVPRTVDLGWNVWIERGDATALSPFEFDQPRELRSTAVLRLDTTIPKMFDDGSVYRPGSRAQKCWNEADERLDIARLCVAIHLQSPVVPVRKTSVFAGTVPAFDGSAAAVFYGSPKPVRNEVLFQKHLDEWADRVRKTHDQIMRLPGELRDRVKIALHRWHTTLVESAAVDVMIDLGIALETMLVPDEMGELTFRLRVRTARLLGSTPARRAELAALVGDAYAARSEAVHRGRLSRKRRAADVDKLIERTRWLVRAVILGMIHRGRDDWNELQYG